MNQIKWNVIKIKKISAKNVQAKVHVLNYENEEAHFSGGTANAQNVLKGLKENLSFGVAKSFLNKEGVAEVYLCSGDKEKFSQNQFRNLGGNFFKFIAAENLNVVEIDGEGFLGGDAAEYFQAFVEGVNLASFRYTNKKEKKKPVVFNLTVQLKTDARLKNFKSAYSVGQIFSDSMNLTRRLGDTPGNLMNPSILAKEAQEVGKNHTSVKVTVWSLARILKEKMGCLYGVSKGSVEEPKFIIMEYNGGAKTKKPIALVGKGLTFDAGGISIKPSPGMDEMKYDMCGGAAVVGAMNAIAALKLKVNVIGVVPASENLVGAAANKPGDILVARDGQTVEVLNTDAEGRLILADALCWVSEKSPKAIFDAATLTGAMVMSLGNSHTGYFTKNPELVDVVERAGLASDENLWRMPLTEDHVNDVKGRHADWANISSFRGAGSATAAAFLRQFVPEEIPHVHFDIAGTAWNQGNRKSYYKAKEATGVLVKTFTEIARCYQ